MSRWLLNAAPSSALVLLFVVVPPALTYAAVLAVRRYRPAVAKGDYRTAGGHLLTQLMAVFGFVLAFVIVNQYSEVTQARADVQAEALNLEDLYRSSLGFEPAARAQVGAAIESYATRVVNDEWHDLRRGHGDAAATAHLNQIYDLLREYRPTTSRGESHLGQANGYLHDVHEARHRRIDAASSSLPPVLAAFLLLGAISVIAVSMLQGVNGHQVMLPLGVASLLGFTLFLSLVLEHPFSGDSAISSVHFQEGSLAGLFEP